MDWIPWIGVAMFQIVILIVLLYPFKNSYMKEWKRQILYGNEEWRREKVEKLCEWVRSLKNEA